MFTLTTLITIDIVLNFSVSLLVARDYLAEKNNEN